LWRNILNFKALRPRSLAEFYVLWGWDGFKKLWKYFQGFTSRSDYRLRRMSKQVHKSTSYWKLMNLFNASELSHRLQSTFKLCNDFLVETRSDTMENYALLNGERLQSRGRFILGFYGEWIESFVVRFLYFVGR
jgi:hypothetical protein